MKTIIEKINNSDIFSTQEKEVLGTLLGVNDDELSKLLVSEPVVQYQPERVVEVLNSSDAVRDMLFRNKMTFQLMRSIMDEHELAEPLIQDAFATFNRLDSDVKSALLAELFICYFLAR